MLMAPTLEQTPPRTLPDDYWDGEIVAPDDPRFGAEAGFDVFLTVDKGIKYQQNFTGRDIAVLTLRGRNNAIETHAPLMPQVLALLPTVQPRRIYFVGAETA